MFIVHCSIANCHLEEVLCAFCVPSRFVISALPDRHPEILCCSLQLRSSVRKSPRISQRTTLSIQNRCSRHRVLFCRTFCRRHMWPCSTPGRTASFEVRRCYRRFSCTFPRCAVESLW